jgi:hypothetical protein
MKIARSNILLTIVFLVIVISLVSVLFYTSNRDNDNAYITSRRTVIIAPGGEPLTEIDSKNATSSSGVASIDVDALETTVKIGTNDVHIRDNAGVFEFSNNTAAGWNDPLDAIHDNVDAEISAITEKTTPVSADLLLIEDSAASNAKKRLQIGNLPADSDAIHDNVASEISAITEKTTPVSADLLVIEDSADSNNKKRLQVGNLPDDSTAIHDDESAEISAITEKTTVVAADLLLIEDSAASNAKKRIQLSTLHNLYLDTQGSDESVNDDATITTLASINNNGWGFITAGDQEEYALFVFNATGTVTLVSNSTNVATSSSDGNLCIYSSGSNGLTIENKLGTTKQIKYEVKY